MKNILVYVSPDKDFNKETVTLAKVQIDNSLAVGWKAEDILLYTNFDYSYNGVEAKIVPDDCYCKHCPTATKIDTIDYLFSQGLVEVGKLYWYHDFDVYQSEPIIKSEVGMGSCVVGFTDYGRIPRWCGSSFFFNTNAKDVFSFLKYSMYKHKTHDEQAIKLLVESGCFDGVFEKLNITYNLQMMNIRSTYKVAVKPVRVLNFHLKVNRHIGQDSVDFFLRGNNKLGVKLASQRLVDVFKQHGVE